MICLHDMCYHGDVKFLTVFLLFVVYDNDDNKDVIFLFFELFLVLIL